MVPVERRLLVLLGAGLFFAALLTAHSAKLGVVASSLWIAGFGVAIGVGSAKPELQWFGTVVSHTRHPRRIALTIDDGPDPQTTPMFLEILAKFGAQATFFVLVDRATNYPALIRQISEQGHEVGLHGPRHEAELTWRSPARGSQWLREGLQGLHELGVGVVPWFRPPFGVVSPRTFVAATAVQLGVAWCSVRTGDGVAIDARRFRARALKARGGDVVLIHEGNPTTVAELPAILAAWTAAGFEVTGFERAQEVECPS